MLGVCLGGSMNIKHVLLCAILVAYEHETNGSIANSFI